MQTIKQRHDDWERAIGIHRAKPAQREEMTKAYYSGFLSALYMLTQDVPSLPDKQAFEFLDERLKEAKEFFLALKPDSVTINIPSGKN